MTGEELKGARELPKLSIENADVSCEGPSSEENVKHGNRQLFKNERLPLKVKHFGSQNDEKTPVESDMQVSRLFQTILMAKAAENS